MKSYEIKQMIIDDNFDGQEYVTADFTHSDKAYSVTFQKADLELINAWEFKEGTSIPAALSENIIESLREDIKKKI
jgi:hypothetical protein